VFRVDQLVDDQSVWNGVKERDDVQNQT
jgi:hypothetical protein